MNEEKTITIKELREALIKHAWNVNANRKNIPSLSVVYPNEVLLELFGEELMKKYWIPDNQTKQTEPTDYQDRDDY